MLTLIFLDGVWRDGKISESTSSARVYWPLVLLVSRLVHVCIQLKKEWQSSVASKESVCSGIRTVMVYSVCVCIAVYVYTYLARVVIKPGTQKWETGNEEIIGNGRHIDTCMMHALGHYTTANPLAWLHQLVSPASPFLSVKGLAGEPIHQQVLHLHRG